jgi:DeoR/GlpR family transcriptional regulator of sugar metabolism
MQTAINAVNYGIKTHCIGGASVNQSVVLSGEQAYNSVVNIFPDILFFSSRSLDTDGYIYDPIPEENHIRELMLKNAKRKVFLCDSEKFGQKSLYRLASINDIDVCVFDKPIPKLSAKCKIIY